MTAPVRIAILGNPSRPDVEWSPTALGALANLGFTGVQLNIAWSFRPHDEPLNLEDVWPLSHGIPSLSAADRLGERQAQLRQRGALAKDAGLRSIFHFGAPFQGRAGFDGAPLPQCISDPAVSLRYAEAVAEFGDAFADVDDILVYTYDQDAWLCSEFGGCDACFGVPLHDRLPAFVGAISAAWQRVRPGGRTWWEPWELSAGQTLACIERIDPRGLGLMLHGSIAEVISTIPADRFFRNAAAAAHARGIPVVAEAFLSSANEEVEPWQRLPVPLVTVRQLRDLERASGVVGVKEYFGVVPSAHDVNLMAAAAYFARPDIPDDMVLDAVAAEFGGGDWLRAFWGRASTAYELYPWDATWFARQLGRSIPAHELSAATVRGMQSSASAWDTPAWRSSRGSVFMRTTNDEPHPWLLEDVGLRFAAAAAEMEAAVAAFDSGFEDDGLEASAELLLQRSEAVGFIVRATAFSLHIRETTLAAMLRESPDDDRLRKALRAALVADLGNLGRETLRRTQGEAAAIAPSALQVAERWIVPDRTDTAPLERAIHALDSDVESFLATYFLPAGDEAAAGQFSLTSR